MITGRVILGALSGGLFGLAVCLAIGAIFPQTGLQLPRVSPRLADTVRRAGPRLGLAGLAALGALALTGWPVLAVGTAGLILLAPGWSDTRAARHAADRLDALSAWIESLRDLLTTGTGLAEAFIRAESAAPALLARPLAALGNRLAAHEPLDQALRALADDLDDPSGDLVAAALILNAQYQGPNLPTVLGDLAGILRDDANVRRRIEADRRAIRRGVRIIVVITIGSMLTLATLAPGYVAAYDTPTGQLVLALVLAVDAAALGWMRRLAAMPTAHRFLRPPIQRESPLRRLLTGGSR